MQNKKLKELYSVLEQMLASAKKKNKKKVLELNKKYNSLELEIFKTQDKLGSKKIKYDKLDLEYDGCRQACILALQWPHMYKEFIKDAEKRLNEIPVPGNYSKF